MESEVDVIGGTPIDPGQVNNSNDPSTGMLLCSQLFQLHGAWGRDETSSDALAWAQCRALALQAAVEPIKDCIVGMGKTHRQQVALCSSWPVLCMSARVAYSWLCASCSRPS